MSHDSQLGSAQFYGILDTGYVSGKNWLPKFNSLVTGGAGIVQVRAKKENAPQRRALLSTVFQTWHQLEENDRPFLIVNDDIELAVEFPGVGLHIGQEDTPPLEARSKLGRERVLGLSTHSIEQAQAAMALPGGTIDYFAVGPVFATQTKPDYTPVGLELVRWVASQHPALPFFCIGGITRANAAQVKAAGGQRVVSVSDVLLEDDTAKAVSEMLAILD